MGQFVGDVERGNLLVDRKRFELELVRLDGKRVLLILDQLSEKKSRQQLGFFFAGVVRTAAQWAGVTEHQMKEWLKRECSPVDIVNKATGQVITVGRDIRDMDKADFSQFINECIVYLLLQGCPIKTPDEYYSELEKRSNDRTAV